MACTEVVAEYAGEARAAEGWEARGCVAARAAVARAGWGWWEESATVEDARWEVATLGGATAAAG